MTLPRPQTLGTLATGRDNNLNLIRMLAATAVMVSHAVPIAVSQRQPEPLQQSLGYTLGYLAVLVFFVVSGFLITASFERSSSRTSFVLARFLRLMPGLFVNLLFVAFLLGPLVTEFSLRDYLTLTDPYVFLVKNLTLFSLDFSLPGVFLEQPFRGVVGSIWTLRHEVACYAAVFVAGLFGLWHSRGRASLALLGFALLWSWLTYAGPRLPAPLPELRALSLPFAVGAAFYVWRDRLPVSLLGVLATVALAWALRQTGLYYPALTLAIGYATFWLGYVPGGILRLYNRLGDYSYGIYLYAFPLQGWAVWAFGPQTAWQNVLYAAGPTLICAVLSWHLVESPSLAAKGRILALCQRLPGLRGPTRARSRSPQ